METTAEKIRHLRKEKGLTQEELARQLGVTNQAVSKWENSLSYPDVTLLPKLAQILETNVDSLLGGGEDISPGLQTEPVGAAVIIEENSPEKARRFISKLGRNFAVAALIGLSTGIIALFIIRAHFSADGGYPMLWPDFYSTFMLYMVYAAGMALLLIPQIKDVKCGALFLITGKLCQGLKLAYLSVSQMNLILRATHTTMTAPTVGEFLRDFFFDMLFWSIIVALLISARGKRTQLKPKLLLWAGIYAALKLCYAVVGYFMYEPQVYIAYEPVKLTFGGMLVNEAWGLLRTALPVAVIILIIKIFYDFTESKTNRVGYSSGARVWFIICLIFSSLLSLMFISDSLSGGGMYCFSAAYTAFAAICLSISYIYLLKRSYAGMVILKCVSIYYFAAIIADIPWWLRMDIQADIDIIYIFYRSLLAPLGFALPMIISIGTAAKLAKKQEL